MDAMEIVKIICLIFLSPLAIFLHKNNQLDMDFWINLILYIVGVGILGLIHAIYVIYIKK
ncbi:hypothetical protein BCR36DRAFT_579449 [Piromyces finnis]|uniref:Uncharacterized protein n=1 Tax=Piromyces finnis TaxID=1754191 RepID=A0A1Y1VNP6_9FUNG|nr:hypothetical protein BCR36DRAFT_579449 [Piromyces finnis]|eukprot:ORX60000.1 hypothetical protein BCR36DRAFT_579449 [Piromyces finnis]